MLYNLAIIKSNNQNTIIISIKEDVAMESVDKINKTNKAYNNSLSIILIINIDTKLVKCKATKLFIYSECDVT